jgi:hypothetical protein
VNRNTITGFIINLSDGRPKAEFIKKLVKLWYIPDSVNVFLQVLARGPVSLYVFRKITPDRTSNNNFLKEFHYYLEREGKISHIKARKQDLLKIMGNDKHRMKEAIRKENLSVRKESGLIRAVEVFNEGL